MSKIIKLFISSSGAETDAPTVDDLLDQLRGYFAILNNVEDAMAELGGNVIEWRVIGASKKSPVALEIEAFPRDYAVNIDRRAELTVQYTAVGLNALQAGSERPPYFNERALSKAERFFGRVMNGLSLTKVDHGDGLPQVIVTPETARVAVRNTATILKPAVPKPYREIGSIEGTFQRVERDGWGRPLLFVKHRLTGETVKCIVSGQAREQIEQQLIAEIWRGRRLQIFGIIYYKSVGQITQVDADGVVFLRSRNQLPQLGDIEDIEFTDGLRSEDYLAKLRDGEIN